jgi:hypothetical protein
MIREYFAIHLVSIYTVKSFQLRMNGHTLTKMENVIIINLNDTVEITTTIILISMLIWKIYRCNIWVIDHLSKDTYKLDICFYVMVYII